MHDPPSLDSQIPSSTWRFVGRLMGTLEAHGHVQTLVRVPVAHRLEWKSSRLLIWCYPGQISHCGREGTVVLSTRRTTRNTNTIPCFIWEEHLELQSATKGYASNCFPLNSGQVERHGTTGPPEGDIVLQRHRRSVRAHLQSQGYLSAHRSRMPETCTRVGVVS